MGRRSRQDILKYEKQVMLNKIALIENEELLYQELQKVPINMDKVSSILDKFKFYGWDDNFTPILCEALAITDDAYASTIIQVFLQKNNFDKPCDEMMDSTSILAKTLIKKNMPIELVKSVPTYVLTFSTRNMTPLDYATEKRMVDVIKIILAKKIDIEETLSAMYIAIKNKYDDIFDIFLQNMVKQKLGPVIMDRPKGKSGWVTPRGDTTEKMLKKLFYFASGVENTYATSKLFI